MTFRKLSKRQLLAMTWWNRPQLKRLDGILCDGAVRSGKTMALTCGFFLWSMASFDRSTGVLTITWACLVAEKLDEMNTVGYGVISLGHTDVIDYDGKKVPVKSSHYMEGNWNQKYPNYHAYAPNTNTVCITDRTHFTSLDAAKEYFAQQKAAGTPVQIYYKLKTPITVQLQPQEILALEGENGISSNTGDTKVSGKADLRVTVENLKNAILALGGNI